MQSSTLPLLRIFCAVALTLACAKCKRSRAEDDDEADDADTCSKRRRNDVERGKLRAGAQARLLAMDATLFRKMFRMSKEAFLLLHSKCGQRINPTWTPRSKRMAQISSGSHVETLLLLACTIRWLAGGSPWDIAYAFHVSYSTLHDKKYAVIDAINEALRGNIAFPTSEEGLQKLADGFAKIAHGTGGTIPNVVAAVDSVVIQRKAPVASKEKNIAGQYCRKGYFATTMLAFVDAAGRFLSVSVRCQASSHDSTLFGCSTLGKKIMGGCLGPKWSIVGDDAFTCCGNIITPFTKHTLNDRQRNYNYFCSLLRQVVECTFGRWKHKWGVLWRPLLVDAENIKAVLECTARLHNYCIDQRCAEQSFVPPLEDLWWTRTASPKVTAQGRAPLPPIAVMQPVWADSATVSAVMGDAQVQRNHRARAVEAVVQSGLVAPDGHGKWARAQRQTQRVNAVGSLANWRV